MDEESVIETTEAEVVAPEIAPVMRTVRILNTDVFDGKYVVVDMQSGEGYMVPVELLQYTTGDQSIQEDALLNCEQPYSWNNEIQSFAVTLQDIRHALWWAGLVSEQRIDIRKLVSLMLRRGTLPVVEIGS